MELIIYLLIGAIAGFAAGLFGVGGGLIVVPILYVVFTYLNYDPTIVMHMAVGTSLATIIVTSISSILAHNNKGGILWPVVRNLAPGLIFGAFFGAGIADLLPGLWLQLLIGVFALSVGFKMFKGANVVVDPHHKLPSTAMQVVAGGGIGIASAIFGIGGGSLTVPFLNKCGVVMQKAVGTSAACGLPIAVAGALGFMWFGEQANIQLPNTIGYIQIYAFVGISVMSFITAKQGAKVAHQLSPAMLKKCFSMLLVVIGIYFVAKALTTLY
ncbi:MULTISPECIES: sulfite exporter TauE/SafE family protein [unclassified Acinetobacter]|uniref:sulfite exporter TauE/SafE family protein n=1 Tax=unclassified Acinetobacter TaxID=196816 RepID=UPI002934F0E3|nr:MULTISPECIES: sulfite exporter TauE/SafE family protein [unclassified Acinetobacter]WOE30334.1 sulfite exporter TauE/SafE family protein [Acinetobacter sp. SAAs470]WOE38525.1 sulfite exporter TauE/SafE family protein [Acinetobacter sp. SAAs474]